MTENSHTSIHADHPFLVGLFARQPGDPPPNGGEAPPDDETLDGEPTTEGDPPPNGGAGDPPPNGG